MTRRKTTAEFVAEARRVHGNRYGYEFAVYISQSKNVQITCKSHGVFIQLPSNHLRGKGCPVCAGKLPVTQVEFIERARAAHGDKYDYSLAEYKSNASKVTIVCKVHGPFQQTPVSHWEKCGCPKCGGRLKLSNEEFIRRAHKVHTDKYNYVLCEYNGQTQKVTVTCPKHGAFQVTGGNHLAGKGCPSCAGNKPLTTASFIAKAREIHGGSYDYSLVRYEKSNKKVQIICPEHGEFEQTPNGHLNGHGCFDCNQLGVRPMTQAEFLAKALLVHGTKYDYSLVEYTRSRALVKIVCKEHGVFEQMPEKHLVGQGCSSCAHSGPSKGQVELSNFLKEHTSVIDEAPILGTNYRLDALLPEHGLGVEYHGLLWHSTRMCADPLRDYKKHKLAEKQGIRVIHIYEDEWLYQVDIVKRTLLAALGVLPKLYARKLSLKEVSHTESRQFYNAHHLQGGRQCAVSYGLMTNDGELVACMSFDILRSERYNKDPTHYELVRYAASAAVIGGASRLLASFIRSGVATKLTSYSDNRLFTGVMYEKMGFTFTKESHPDYYYTTCRPEFGRQHKSRYQKKHLAKMFPGADLSKTEWEICKENGLHRIYDCGKKRWDLELTPTSQSETRRTSPVTPTRPEPAYAPALASRT